MSVISADRPGSHVCASREPKTRVEQKTVAAVQLHPERIISHKKAPYSYILSKKTLVPCPLGPLIRLKNGTQPNGRGSARNVKGRKASATMNAVNSVARMRARELILESSAIQINKAAAGPRISAGDTTTSGSNARPNRTSPAAPASALRPRAAPRSSSMSIAAASQSTNWVMNSKPSKCRS